MRIFILIATLLFSALHVSAQVPTESQNTAASQDTGNGTDNTKDFTYEGNSDGEVITSPPSEKREADSAKGDSNFKHKSTSYFSVSDVIAMVLGGAALIFTGVGIRQNRISNEKQNRAYVGIQGIKLILDDHTPSKLDVRIDFGNTGQTPANNAVVRSRLKIINISDEVRTEEFESQNTGNHGAISGGGKGSTDISLDAPSIEDAQYLAGAIIDGRSTIEVDGVIEYSDTYGGQNKTLFSATLNTIKDLETNFRLTDNGNEMT